MTTALERAAYQAGCRLEGCAQLVVARLAQRPPRRELCRPERLRLPLVADSCDEPLVEERVAQCPARILPAKAREHLVDPGVALEDVRAETCDPARMELEYGPVPLHALVRRAAEDEPGPPAPRRAARHERPAAVHPQVAAEDIAALEGEQQVLADGLDRQQAAPVETLRDPAHLRTRVRRLHLDPFPH